MDLSLSVTEWIDGLRLQEAEAARRLWRRYYDRLVHLAAAHLRGRKRRAFDEEDIAAAVLTAFCVEVGKGRYPEISDRDALWRWLLRVTENRVIDAVRKEQAGRRGDGEVRGESVFAAADGEAVAGFNGVAGVEPTPAFAAEMAERVEELFGLLDGQAGAGLRRVAEMKLEGYTDQEVADRLGCTTRTVERKLKAIREIWEKAAAPAPPPAEAGAGKSGENG